jgi:hypothetical protein
VPAKVEGTWKLPQGELSLKQEFQMLSGTLNANGTSSPVTGKMRGEQITFTANQVEYTGQVNGNSIEGSTKANTTNGSWSATRVQ